MPLDPSLQENLDPVKMKNLVHTFIKPNEDGSRTFDLSKVCRLDRIYKAFKHLQPIVTKTPL
jgi:hypothetical protein